MSKEIKDTLIAAWAKIEDPNHWIQRSSAKNTEGVICESCSPSAVKWCAIGAVKNIVGPNDPILDQHIVDVLRKLNAAAVIIFNKERLRNFSHAKEAPRPIIFVNDYLGHEQVGKCFKHAIETCERTTNENS